MSIYKPDSMIYWRGTPIQREMVSVDIHHDDLSYDTTMFMYVVLLQSGVTSFPCRDGTDRHLSAEKRLEVMKFVHAHRERLASGNEKSYQGWRDTDLDLQEYLRPGDTVDDEMVEYFRNVMPPLVNKSGLLQTSEPFVHIPDESHSSAVPAYVTFYRDETGKWKYAGICKKGNSTNAYTYKSALEREIERLTEEEVI